jgi:formylglycine-generating enzyme required for sulfatase activity
MKVKLLKGFATVLGAVLLSTLGIYAADKLQGIDTGNIANIHSANGCSQNAVPVKVDGQVLCVDIYEASPSEECPHKELHNIIESEKNTNTQNCFAISTKDSIPWNYISLPQAQRMCAAAGKRLPKNAEWYHVALGTNPDQCVIGTQGSEHTGIRECVSSIGAHDVVGNVWEWVDETVVNNTFDGRALPSEGYVTSVDAKGIAISSGADPDDLYGRDYFWSRNEGVFGMIRGGFYGSNQDAGLYTVNASMPTSFAAQGVGFRCVEDLL